MKAFIETTYNSFICNFKKTIESSGQGIIIKKQSLKISFGFKNIRDIIKRIEVSPRDNRRRNSPDITREISI